MEPGELIFGTDGVRDLAGSGYLAPESIRKFTRAISRALQDRSRFLEDFPPDSHAGNHRKVVFMGRDTRESGLSIARIMREEFQEAGLVVVDLGVIPTPGVSRLAACDSSAVLGVMISASHNPAEYNGIKLLAPSGAKATDRLEKNISDTYWQDGSAVGGNPVEGREDPGALERYADLLAGLCRNPERLRGKKIVLDTANGATFRAAPLVFQKLGAVVTQIGGQPDGRNINSGCGALHPRELARAVVETGAVVGFGFDGDGDRMLAVTPEGQVLDGDHFLAVVGRFLHRAGRLPGKTVVATQMSNLGLEKALVASGLRLLRTAVGDRHVYRAMVEGNHPLGGEQSGHVIFLEHARTGDGILAAICLLDCLDEDLSNLAAEAAVMVSYPQVLLNYEVPRKVPFQQLPRVVEALAEVEAALKGEGRVLLRYSGTEPLARVMIEGPDPDLIDRLARKIGKEILESIETVP